jgi:hypothetical protein
VDLLTLPVHIDEAAFTPDGTGLLASAGNVKGGLFYWSAGSAGTLRALRSPHGAVDSVGLSADGARLLALSGGRARAWDVRTGAAVDGKAPPPPAGQRVILGPGRGLRAWISGAYVFLQTADENTPAAQARRREDDWWAKVTWHQEQARLGGWGSRLHHLESLMRLLPGEHERWRAEHSDVLASVFAWHPNDPVVRRRFEEAIAGDDERLVRQALPAVGLATRGPLPVLAPLALANTHRAKLLAWHEQQARAGVWRARVFHLDRLMRFLPGEQERLRGQRRDVLAGAFKLASNDLELRHLVEGANEDERLARDLLPTVGLVARGPLPALAPLALANARLAKLLARHEQQARSGALGTSLFHLDRLMRLLPGEQERLREQRRNLLASVFARAPYVSGLRELLEKACSSDDDRVVLQALPAVGLAARGPLPVLAPLALANTRQAKLLAWHEQQARAGVWQARVFHLDRLMRFLPGEQERLRGERRGVLVAALHGAPADVDLRRVVAEANAGDVERLTRHLLPAVGLATRGPLPALAPLALARTHLSRPFLVLKADGRFGGRYATFVEAVQLTESGGIVEIQADGPFAIAGIVRPNQALTIRAAPGTRPVLEAKEAKGELLHTHAALTLEGLDLRFTPASPKTGGGTLIWCGSGPLRLRHCRFFVRAECIAVFSGSPHCEARNCEFDCAPWAGPMWRPPSGGQMVLEGCLLRCATSLQMWGPLAKPARAQLRNNTIRFGNAFELITYDSFRKASALRRRIDVAAVGNVFDPGSAVLMFNQNQKAPLPFPEAEAALRAMMTWQDQGNVYQAGRPFISYRGNWQALPGARVGGGLAEWGKLWGQAKVDAVQGAILYQGKVSAAEATPRDFRVRADSVGHRRGAGGKDAGAATDEVGPGAPYERWRKGEGKGK